MSETTTIKIRKEEKEFVERCQERFKLPSLSSALRVLLTVSRDEWNRCFKQSLPSRDLRDSTGNLIFLLLERLETLEGRVSELETSNEGTKEYVEELESKVESVEEKALTRVESKQEKGLARRVEEKPRQK